MSPGRYWQGPRSEEGVCVCVCVAGVCVWGGGCRGGGGETILCSTLKHLRLEWSTAMCSGHYLMVTI